MSSRQLGEIIDRTGPMPKEHKDNSKYNNELTKRLQANISPIRHEPVSNRHRLNISPNSPRRKNNNDDLPPAPTAPAEQTVANEVANPRATSLKDFAIMSKLGDGAYSSVYKVKRLADGQMYALKKAKLGSMSYKDKENAINEVRILASIHHPNVIAYKEAFVDQHTESLW